METILVVDDDPVLLNLINHLLKNHYNVVLCSSGEEAVDQCRTQCKDNNSAISLALFDFDMSGMNGIEAAKIIWSEFKIPFILMSQFDDNHVVAEAIKIGAINYLLKPLKLEELLNTVNAAIARSKEYKVLLEESSKAVDLVSTLNQNRKYLKKIISAETQNRKDLVNALHNEVGQEIAYIKNCLYHLSKENDSSNTTITKYIFEIEKSVTRLGDNTRSIMLHLRPEALVNVEIGAAINYLITNFSNDYNELNVTSDIDQSISMEDPDKSIVYFCAQELLTNIVKYAKATNIHICFRLSNNAVELVVEDDGAGFDVNTTSTGIGLIAMREKVNSLGGTFSINSSPGCGTKTVIAIPVN